MLKKRSLRFGPNQPRIGVVVAKSQREPKFNSIDCLIDDLMCIVIYQIITRLWVILLLLPKSQEASKSVLMLRGQGKFQLGLCPSHLLDAVSNFA